MTNSILLVEGDNIIEEDLRGIGLSNAKHLVVGKATGFGIIISLASNTIADHNGALQEFIKIPNVTNVTTLGMRK